MEDFQCCAGSWFSTGQQETVGAFVQRNAMNRAGKELVGCGVSS